MDNYKIKVKDEAESKEAQELFFELGFRWKWTQDKEVLRESTPYLFTLGANIGYGLTLTKFDECVGKELTLPQLRDLVVLKRNDVKDATHTGTGDSKYYVDSNGDSYIHNSIIWTEWKLDISILKPIKKHLETATGRFDENGEHHITFNNGAEEKDPALISGADALRALADGKDVEANNSDFGYWIDARNLSVKDFFDDIHIFRLKPQTIKLELELPKPFEPKDGEVYYYLKPSNAWGFGCGEWGDDSMQNEYIQYGAWPTKEDVLKVVEQLRKIRGTNS